MISADQLLLTREAKGLKYTISARFIFGLIFVPVVLVMAKGNFELILNLAIVALIIIMTLYFYQLVRQERKLNLVGYGGVAFDLFTLMILPISWYDSAGGVVVPAAFLLKTGLPVLSILYMIINSLAMRPAYPAIMTAGSVIIQLSFLPYVLSDSRTVLSSDLSEVLLGPAVSLELFFTLMMFVVVSGLFLTFINYAARKTVYEAVNLERSNMEIKEEQIQLVMHGKMDALSNLVAGMAHELNNPLGAVQSAVDIISRSVEKITADAKTESTSNEVDQSGNLAKYFKALQESSIVAESGMNRIKDLVDRLKNFVRLDEEEFRNADLHEGIENTLALLQSDIGDNINIERDYAELPQVYCSPKKLNLVFMSLLTNAVQAIDGQGLIRIASSYDSDNVIISISDDGKGIEKEKLESIFEFGFGVGDSRVKMSSGLAVAYNILKSHQGELNVESKEGEGSTFKITLPIDLMSKIKGTE